MARITSKGGLTDKQESFCNEYIIDKNGQKAAERAKYSKNTARTQASKMLTKDHIKKRILEIQAEIAVKVGITRETQLAKLDQATSIALSQNNPSAMVSAIREQQGY